MTGGRVGEEFRSADGEALFVHLDVTDEESWRQAVASSGLSCSVSGSRWTSVSQTWCATTKPVRSAVWYGSRSGPASRQTTRSVSSAFCARAGACGNGDAHARRGRAGLVVRLLRGLTIGAVVRGNNPHGQPELQ